jgi:transposase-like protein
MDKEIEHYYYCPSCRYFSLRQKQEISDKKLIYTSIYWCPACEETWDIVSKDE